MIKTKADLKEYLSLDKKARFKTDKISFFQYIQQKELWKFNLHLRKAEYHFNNHSFFHKLLYLYHRLRQKNMLINWVGRYRLILAVPDYLSFIPER